MDAWQAAEAERDFAKLLDTASRSGLQVVMREAHPTAVIMSMDDYQVLKEQADRQFAAFLLASPMEAEDFGDGPSLTLTGSA
ncbi:type II toxin-antitoxin system Phd/YefM family antitoxin [Methylobacterium trifolii]|uniref:Antitoxin n=1 Tax=Methylobacterium trifolii TaxID=1003092 RepID=A0ABQ4TV24_9HYPH|nr:type II toxin-antitoxin system Phd/YefM family antitoxin [Methylobacterium trifolii]GJE59080.1 hypothetical protein MPOCJGCO_1167 [Methylobacterium trifolii]